MKGSKQESSRQRTITKKIASVTGGNLHDQGRITPFNPSIFHRDYRDPPRAQEQLQDSVRFFDTYRLWDKSSETHPNQVQTGASPLDTHLQSEKAITEKISARDDVHYPPHDRDRGLRPKESQYMACNWR